jgi:hypothetical protein
MATTTKKTVKKPAAQKQFKDEFIDDPDAVDMVYTADDHDPAYDDNIANDTAFDYDDASEDPGDYDDHDEPKNNRK